MFCPLAFHNLNTHGFWAGRFARCCGKCNPLAIRRPCRSRTNGLCVTHVLFGRTAGLHNLYAAADHTVYSRKRQSVSLQGISNHENVLLRSASVVLPFPSAMFSFSIPISQQAHGEQRLTDPPQVRMIHRDSNPETNSNRSRSGSLKNGHLLPLCTKCAPQGRDKTHSLRG